MKFYTSPQNIFAKAIWGFKLKKIPPAPSEHTQQKQHDNFAK